MLRGKKKMEEKAEYEEEIKQYELYARARCGHLQSLIRGVQRI